LYYPRAFWREFQDSRGLLVETEQALLAAFHVTKARGIFFEVSRFASSAVVEGAELYYRATCLAAKGHRYEEAAVMGDTATWKEAQDIWAKHCFHRHAKCHLHPQSCNTSSCPAHGARTLADSPVKTELKREREGSSAPLLVK
jgi:hypothetical protein